jgi:hypothetical protein
MVVTEKTWEVGDWKDDKTINLVSHTVFHANTNVSSEEKTKENGLPPISESEKSSMVSMLLCYPKSENPQRP